MQQMWRHPYVGKQPDDISGFGTAGNCLWPSNFSAAFSPDVAIQRAWPGDVNENFTAQEAQAAASAWLAGTAASAMGPAALTCSMNSHVACEGTAALKSNPPFVTASPADASRSKAAGNGGARRANRRPRAAPIGSGAAPIGSGSGTTPIGGSPSMGMWSAPAQQPTRVAAEARTGPMHVTINANKVDKSTQVEAKESSARADSDEARQPNECVPSPAVGPPPGLHAPPGLSQGTKPPRAVQLEQLLPLPRGSAPEPPTLAVPLVPSLANDITAAKASAPLPPGTTTVMLRNIPNRYTPEELLEEMLSHGFEGCFDFFYLPTDFGTKKNMGYGFLNLRTPALAENFRRTFDRRRLTRYVTQKVLEMSPAVTQGFQANVMKYLKHQAGRVQNPWFRPMIFVPNEGSGVQWCCFSLCEEHLPDSVRRMIKDTSTGGSACSSSASSSSTQAPSPSRSPIAVAEDLHGDESCNESEAGETASPDADTAVVMQAAVSKFLRACGDGSTDGEEHNGLTTVDAPIASSAASTVPKVPSRRGRRGRGGHGQRTTDPQASDTNHSSNQSSSTVQPPQPDNVMAN